MKIQRNIVSTLVSVDRKVVVTKEQADHSLPDLLSVALPDREIYPEQLTIDKINWSDVQEVLNNVKVTT